MCHPCREATNRHHFFGLHHHHFHPNLLSDIIHPDNRALDTIGNNVANATTEGYHRQRLELSPARQNTIGQFSYGTGVDVEGITRVMDRLLEAEILLQTSSSEAVKQELSALQTIETAFGEFGGADALNTYINTFFESMQDLATHPNDLTWQHQFVSAAEVMASQFRTLGTSLAVGRLVPDGAGEGAP